MMENISLRCRSCNGHSVFIGTGGHLTCSYVDCKEPSIERQFKQFEGENERIRNRNHQGTYCAYCGETFPLDINHTYLRVGIHIWECEKHPLNVLCEEIEERCKDLDHDAQEHLETGKAFDLFHANGIRKSIDRIREVINDGKRHCKEMRDELDTLKESD